MERYRERERDRDGKTDINGGEQKERLVVHHEIAAKCLRGNAHIGFGS